MIIELGGFTLELSLEASRHGQWLKLPLTRNDRGVVAHHAGLRAEFDLEKQSDCIRYLLRFAAEFPTRLRLRVRLLDQQNLFHLIPANIHGDNNAQHVRPGEFPCLTGANPAYKNCSPLWEFRADRASHPVSILCCDSGAVGVSIDPYSTCEQAEEGFIRNGVFAALPDSCGVSLGYGNDPLTFFNKNSFLPATQHLARQASAAGMIFAFRGQDRRQAHKIIRALYQQLHQTPTHQKTLQQALAGLAESFATVNFDPRLQQYTNRKCQVPTDTELKPWRAIVEIGWTGGSMLAYPLILAERILPSQKLPKTGWRIFNEICSGFNEVSGFINDTTINRFTQNRPQGWNESEINGWWSGFLPQTRDNHCAYTNGHAAYYLLRTLWITKQSNNTWLRTALRVLDTVIELQRDDGALGYVFSSRSRQVVDWDGFAGVWFVAAMPYAWKFTEQQTYLDAASRAMDYYRCFVRNLACWGAPMDTCKSVDSEGNLGFMRAARLLHEMTQQPRYLEMLIDSAHYEYLWRYGFRTRPQCPPLKGSNWNSCGGSITSVSNPHIHPMSVVATDDLEYLARISGDVYHQTRAEDGLAWIMNTLELYPEVMGYGRYGVLSERTCPSDGLLSERYADTGLPASTWWSYNAWAAGSAMEAIAEKLLASATA